MNPDATEFIPSVISSPHKRENSPRPTLPIPPISSTSSGTRARVRSYNPSTTFNPYAKPSPSPQKWASAKSTVGSQRTRVPHFSSSDSTQTAPAVHTNHLPSSRSGTPPSSNIQSLSLPGMSSVGALKMNHVPAFNMNQVPSFDHYHANAHYNLPYAANVASSYNGNPYSLSPRRGWAQSPSVNHVQSVNQPQAAWNGVNVSGHTNLNSAQSVVDSPHCPMGAMSPGSSCAYSPRGMEPSPVPASPSPGPFGETAPSMGWGAAAVSSGRNGHNSPNAGRYGMNGMSNLSSSNVPSVSNGSTFGATYPRSYQSTTNTPSHHTFTAPQRPPFLSLSNPPPPTLNPQDLLSVTNLLQMRQSAAVTIAKPAAKSPTLNQAPTWRLDGRASPKSHNTQPVVSANASMPSLKPLDVSKFNERAPTYRAPPIPVSPSNARKHPLAKTSSPSSQYSLLERQLCRILGQLTVDQKDRVLSKLLKVLNDSVQTQKGLKVMVDMLLRFVMLNPIVVAQVAKILFHFNDYLPRIILTQRYQQHQWDKTDVDLRLTFRKILVNAMQKMFDDIMADLGGMDAAPSCDSKAPSAASTATTRSNAKGPKPRAPNERARKEKELISMVTMVGSVHNMDLIKFGVVRKGLLDYLLPREHNGQQDAFELVHVRALCAILRTCGRKMDHARRRDVSRYLDLTIRGVELLANDRDQLKSIVMLNELMELRRNNWTRQPVEKWVLSIRAQMLLYRQPLNHIVEEVTDEATDEGADGAPPSHSNQSMDAGNEREDKMSNHSEDPVDDGTRRTLWQFDADCGSWTALPIESVRSVQCGLNDSYYVVDRDHKLSVAGNNEHGELGIESEIIRKVLLEWHPESGLIADILDVITRFVDQIKFTPDRVSVDTAQRIELDVPHRIGFVSKGVTARHRFVVTVDNELYGSGCNRYNQLLSESPQTMHLMQQMDPMQSRRRWAKISYFSDNKITLRDIDCGYSSSTFLSSEGKVYVAGFSAFGNLGFGDKHYQSHTALLMHRFRTKMVSISCGFEHTLALSEEHAVFSWGDNEFGQLGHGNDLQDRKLRPKVIDYFGRCGIHCAQIACGAFHSAVLDCEGKLYLFGFNLEHQCHPGSDRGIARITEIGRCRSDMPLGGERATAQIGKILEIKCGAFHNAARVEVEEEVHRKVVEEEVSGRSENGGCAAGDGHPHGDGQSAGGRKRWTWYLWGSNKSGQCLQTKDAKESVKYPTRFDGKGLPEGAEVIALFPGFRSTRVLTTFGWK